MVNLFTNINLMQAGVIICLLWVNLLLYEENTKFKENVNFTCIIKFMFDEQIVINYQLS